MIGWRMRERFRLWMAKQGAKVYWTLSGGAVSTAVAASPLAQGACRGNCLQCAGCGSALALVFSLPVAGKVIDYVKHRNSKHEESIIVGQK
ncbi:MAG TPA: hypothetical protein VJ824_05300 [Bacillota bacterium]|nr:hypothetical protein [Bacillota bacterium]